MSPMSADWLSVKSASTASMVGGRRTKTPQRARSKKACRGTARKGCASRTRKGRLDYTTKKGSKFYNRGSRRQRRAQGTKRKSRPYAKLIKALGL